MMQVRIKEGTSIKEIVSWLKLDTTSIEFRISRNSSFQLLAEGLVPAVVDKLHQVGVSLSLRLDLALPSVETLPEIFTTLAGYSLAYNCSFAIDDTGNQILEPLLNLLWRQIALPRRGVVGDGKHLCLISREPDSPVPAILKGDERTTIPTRADFQAVLRRLGQNIGVAGQIRQFTGEFLNSSNEDQVATFLYEAFRNVQDHVNPARSGIWGVLVEKLVIVNEAHISKQSRIPDSLKAYLTGNWNRRPNNKSMFVVAISVVDYGRGIHNTLQRKSGEADIQVIERAFTRGESRKPKSGSPNWGQGLPNILDAASRLDAFLFIHSAGVVLQRDTYTKEGGWMVSDLNCGQGGTMISIVWPIKDENADQQWLPLFDA